VVADADVAFDDSFLHLTVRDDGTGTSVSVNDIQLLAKSGHFGLLGMLERAASMGAGIQLGRGEHGGTEVKVDVPLATPLPEPPSTTPQQEAAHA
jgi:signal transduction histidine kinase